MRFLKRLNIELPCDPTSPLLGIYPEKNIVWKDTCTPVFTAALFAITKTWKQPKADVVHTYSGILLSHKKEWNNAIYSNMDGPRDYHAKWSKTDKYKSHISLICGI